MALKIYNTLTRSKEIFEPLTPGKVKMYVCGPTVYNYIHIGNARPFIFFDVVRRYLTAIGYEVSYVMNFTDVDDKLIRKSLETGMSVPELSDKFIEAFYEDVGGLGIREATVHPRVTENMQEIIQFIQGLTDSGYAYEKEGDVYFRTEKYPKYGELSHKNLEELQYGIRVEVDERKEDPRDFVLWKKAKPGEIKWSSPWGEGRPGWHIECSTMAKKYLGETLDIHGGGQDLQFPHHECERAQSEALNGQTFVKYWMHNGYININNEKMSKSLNNGIDVRDMLQMYRFQVIRFFMLSAHYRSPLNFSHEIMEHTGHSLERIDNCLADLRHRRKTAMDAVLRDHDRAFMEKIDQAMERFHEKMQEDFNTPDAITAVFDMVSEANLYLKSESIPHQALQHAMDAFKQIDDIFGILQGEEAELLDEEVEKLIAERIEARKNKNWARADEIRDQLTAKGIQLEDTQQGIRWRRKV
ncbi:cysteine--tRNA ligase [Ferviditalea candida]|uniref:Cysteine--tRNA ligase n=1 Tax=Ferviditalea candida TaxID=3108399 RepID=A0ABU5ZM92_9BACL|nr:cysteine--tRNA ligase [Paenibacillaceae bacterium T2]